MFVFLETNSVFVLGSKQRLRRQTNRRAGHQGGMKDLTFNEAKFNVLRHSLRVCLTAANER